MFKQFNRGINYRALSIAMVSVVSGIIALLMPDWRHNLLAIYEPIPIPKPIPNPLTQNRNLNQTQTNSADTVFDACFNRNATLQDDFRNTCNALVGAAFDNANSQTDNAVRALSPEQLFSTTTTATRTTASQLSVISSAIDARMQNLRAGLNSSTPYTGLALNRNSKALSKFTGGAAGEDDSGGAPPFGIWANTNYQAGDVNSTFEQLGYDFKSGGLTLGIDTRLTNDLIVGTAFNYLAGDAFFDRNGGRSQTNSYTGSIYTTYYVIDNVHLNALASYGGTEYNINRNVQYTITGDSVDSTFFGSPGGEQYSLSFGGGYDYSTNGFNLNPYARIEYKGLQVDSFQETEFARQRRSGLGLRVGQQNVQSLTTTLGAQTSYAISTSFGVLLPSFRAEWNHQYSDNSRVFTTSFQGDLVTNAPTNIVTRAPDRDYAVLGAGLSGTFANGLSAFISYDALLGYQNVTSHKVVIGARLEF